MQYPAADSCRLSQPPHGVVRSKAYFWTLLSTGGVVASLKDLLLLFRGYQFRKKVVYDYHATSCHALPSAAMRPRETSERWVPLDSVQSLCLERGIYD
jgi:hypothetical protein